MPTRITGIAGRRKSNRKRAETRSRQPSPFSDKLVECLVENRRIGGFADRRLPVVAEANNWLGPRPRVTWIAPQISPKNGARLGSRPARKSAVDSHEAVICVPPSTRDRWPCGRLTCRVSVGTNSCFWDRNALQGAECRRAQRRPSQKMIRVRGDTEVSEDRQNEELAVRGESR